MLQEVFKTNHLERYEDSEILGKCIVLFYRDYVKGTVKGFDKKDVIDGNVGICMRVEIQ